MQERLERCIEEARLRRAEKAAESRQILRKCELREKYSQWVKNLVVEDGPYPTLSELWSLPEMKVIITEDESRVVIGRERFDKAIVPVMQQYKLSTRAAIVKALRSKAGKSGEHTEENKVDDESEDILYNATSLFMNPHRTESWFALRQDKGLLSFRELLVDLHDMYEDKRINDGQEKITYTPSFTKEIACSVLRAVGLSQDTLYEEVTGRIVCACQSSDFSQPASFSKLVRVPHLVFKLKSNALLGIPRSS